MARNKENQKRIAKEWYEKNKELVKERARAWALANPEKRKQSIDKWREENREHHNATNRDWSNKNKDRKAALQAKRKASQLLRTPKWLTEQDLKTIQGFYSVAAMLSRENNEPWHVDHIIPLQGKKVSGLHTPLNLQVIPASENVKKSNKHPI